MMYMRALVLYMLMWITVAYQQPMINFTDMKPSSSKSFFLRISGNVYPKGFYTATIYIGKSPKPYFLDIDSGSDLTWVTCDVGGTPRSSNPHYDFRYGADVIKCSDSQCSSFLGPPSKSDLHNDCASPTIKDRVCEYQVSYADGTSGKGILVRDTVHFRRRSNELLTPRLIFGCAFYPKDHPAHQNIQSGMLGLGKGTPGFMKQLSDKALFPNVFGHCLGRQDGFIFFGDDSIPLSRITWTPLLHPQAEHYLLGSAHIMFSGEDTDIKDLDIIFDCGSTYTYFNSLHYSALLDLITRNLRGLPIQKKHNDGTIALPVCWESAKPFKQIGEVASYFKPLALRFKGARFQVPPENYLIISGQGHVCLGILDSSLNALGDKNVVGDNFMQNNLVVYDNDKGRVGWAPVYACVLPK